MDLLEGLWDLYESDINQRMSSGVETAKTGKTDLGGGVVKQNEIQRKPQQKPELRPEADSNPPTVGSPNQVMQSNPAANPNLSPEMSKSQQVDDLRKSGMPTGQAFQQVHGDIDDFSDQTKVGDIARAFGRTQSDKSSAQSVRIDKDSESLLGQDHEARAQDTAPTQMDGMSGQNSEVSDQDQEDSNGVPQSDVGQQPNPNAPEFAQQKGFTDQLPSDNNTYLNKIQESGHSNGTDFVDLKQELGDKLPQGVPAKYLDVLSRALVTKNVKGKTDNWKHYGEGLSGGAGQINSQMGELMALVMSNVKPEDRDQFSSVIRNQINSAKKNGAKKGDLTITEDWLDASLKNAEAVDRYMELEGDGATVAGGAWDQADELESLGIGGKDGEEKGFSTDMVIRDSNGKNHQISLKKDGNVNFLNSGAGQYSKYYLSGAAEDPSNPHHEKAKQYMSDIDKVNELYSKLGMEDYDGESLPTVPSQKKLKDEYGLSSEEAKKTSAELNKLKDSISDVRNDTDIVPKGYNLSEYNKQENNSLSKSFKTLGNEIRSLDLNQLNTPSSEMFADAYNDGNFPEELKDRFFDDEGNPLDKPKSKRKGDDKEEYDRAKSLLQQSAKDAKAGEIKDKVEKIMEENNIESWDNFVDRLEDGDIPGLSQRERNKLMMNAIFATKSDTAKEHRTQMKQRERDFSSNAIKAISEDPVMKSGTLNSLRKNFPLKDVAEGKESMVIGDATFSKKVLGKMFGTTDFNQIKDKLVVKTDKKGTPYLGYQIEVDADDDGESEETIPIANVNVRADGLGYGNTIKHEMKMRPDFYKRLQKINAEMGTNMTAEEVLSLFFGNKKLFVEAIQHLIPVEDTVVDLTEEDCIDYNDDVDFLRTYGRA